ncbi:hypothetical protein [Methanobacterium sp.]|uniref:hypothetical protein n=1 Tax=Methanobacterium sp. TaxID=2164 RepID=UPI002ABD01DE|nr:hypothetical protein [Methanobacterium sp.]MDY9922215.1 hypothetical protein [Methanobacterium sp.]
MIKNKIIAIILAILTFITGTAFFVGIIFYFAGYPLSSIGEHQLYLFFAVLIGAVLASVVYGRGSNDRAIRAAKCVDELLGVKVKTNDMWRILRGVEQMPIFVINDYVSKDINGVEAYEEGIREYKSKLTDENLQDIRRIIDKPIPELQNVLNELYLETDLEQFKILADPSAEPLITMNLQELKRILFNE